NEKPFISINCAAIPEHLFESELFGYEAGAFTGAKREGKQGKFQLADGGTLFLDEIGDMSLSTQVKLLRVLQEGEIQKVGGTTSYKIDVRIITATNQMLDKLVEDKKFRKDLYYRINVMNIHIPPLRNRPDDMMIIANYLLTKLTEKAGKRVTSFSEEVVQLFHEHTWPGNIRELENVIQSAIFLTNNEVIEREDVPKIMQPDVNKTIETKNLKSVVKQAEKDAILQVLKETSNKKTVAKK